MTDASDRRPAKAGRVRAKGAPARPAGFYATHHEQYYITPGGRAWVVASVDDLGTDAPVEIGLIPRNAKRIDDLLTPAERIEHCRRVEAAGEVALPGDA